ncbi:NUDIX hydrolase [Blastopirellula marina]|uniref:GDP-mannose pyrophosphatase n=1 Tax=Blastopirellula marina TaxID=124 RepID=A0A2S8F717_9BACT|nr:MULTISPECIES: NUDIX hydrolase [Pirellulaceae]PQO27938.1 NUDIX hydrolase [Blastopirellula marina]RCS48363.1 NUDIX hydrolase [Bremerella cremea]
MKSPETVFEGVRFNIERVWQGKRPRDVMRHPGAAVILPLVDDNHVCLIKSYRISVDQTLLELPAGTLEPNEPPEVTASRELEEETGYRAEKIELLTGYYPSPGVMDERMFMYLATGLTMHAPAREEGEEIENHVVTLDEAKAMIQDGRIADGKTIAGLLFYFQFRT